MRSAMNDRISFLLAGAMRVISTSRSKRSTWYFDAERAVPTHGAMELEGELYLRLTPKPGLTVKAPAHRRDALTDLLPLIILGQHDHLPE